MVLERKCALTPSRLAADTMLKAEIDLQLWLTREPRWFGGQADWPGTNKTGGLWKKARRTDANHECGAERVEEKA